MRVTPATLASHRAALLDQAARLFRRQGLDGVNVAEISHAAGLTHGAFYGHFPSKLDLAAEACGKSMQDGAAHWRARAISARARGQDPLTAIIDGFLTPQHRDTPEDGCTLTALGGEIVRAAPKLRAALDDGVAALTAVLEEELAAHRPNLAQDARAATALAVLSGLVGGLIVARACTSPERSEAALAHAAAMARAACDAPRHPSTP